MSVKKILVTPKALEFVDEWLSCEVSTENLICELKQAEVVEQRNPSEWDTVHAGIKTFEDPSDLTKHDYQYVNVDDIKVIIEDMVEFLMGNDTVDFNEYNLSTRILGFQSGAVLYKYNLLKMINAIVAEVYIAETNSYLM